MLKFTANILLLNNTKGNGESYLKDISSGENTLVSSLPVQVCLCGSNECIYNCTHQRHVEMKKGQKFTLSVVAVDQIGQPVNGTIQTSLHFTESDLAEGQLARKIPAECTDLIFSIVSPHNSDNLTLYASDGPLRMLNSLGQQQKSSFSLAAV